MPTESSTPLCPICDEPLNLVHEGPGHDTLLWVHQRCDVAIFAGEALGEPFNDYVESIRKHIAAIREASA